MRPILLLALALLAGCPNPGSGSTSTSTGSSGSSSTGSTGSSSGASSTGSGGSSGSTSTGSTGSSTGTSGSGSTGSSGATGSSSGSSGSSGTTGCAATGLHCGSNADCCSGSCQGNICYAVQPSCQGDIGDTCYDIDFPGCCTGQCVLNSEASGGSCCKSGVSMPCTSDADCCGAAPYDLAGRTVCGADGQCTFMHIPPDAGSACVGLGSSCATLGCCSGLTCAATDAGSLCSAPPDAGP